MTDTLDDQIRINFDKAMQKLGEQSEALLKEAGLYENFKAWQKEHGVEARTAQSTINGELTFEQQQVLTEILEAYRNNPSNSNKYSSELDEILIDLLMNSRDLDYSEFEATNISFPEIDKAKAKLEALITEQVVKELESLHKDIFSDAGTPNHAMISKLINNRINQLKGNK